PIGPGLKRQGVTTNLVLSQKRADNVMQFMISQGVNPSLMSSQGFGDADPVASNDTADGQAQNRRVELTLSGSGCSPSAQVGQFQAIEEERVFGSSITAEGAGDEIENRYAIGRSGEGGTRYKAGDPAALFG